MREEGWTFYDCGCGYEGERFVACGSHYFTYNGPVEQLARAAHMKGHPDCGVYAKDADGIWPDKSQTSGPAQ
jgi:hypothetical protein